MEATGEYRIGRDRETVWAALNDSAMLEKCIPGCDALQPMADGGYEGRVSAAVGPVKAVFDTRIRIENLHPPESYRLSGESRAAAGFGRGHVDVTLLPEGDGTLLRYNATFRVGGRLAQVGSRLVVGTLRKTADAFFSCLGTELEQEAPQRSAVAGGTPLRRLWWAAGVLLLLVMAGWLFFRD